MRLQLLVIGLMAFLVRPAFAADLAGDLAAPVKIQAAGKPIDVDLGHAAPFWADLKGDGAMSLLVGGGEGRCRIYHSHDKGATSKKTHHFESFTWFEGKIPAAAGAGFTPVLFGNDILSGSRNGELYNFRGDGKGTFKAAEVLMDRDGHTINLGKDSTVFPVDWKGKGTGKVDLLVGTADGTIHLIPNEAADKEKKDGFGKPRKLEADGKPIQVPLGYAHPVMADWDKDGLPDLIVGTGAGSVLWYRNVGSREEPKFNAALTLVGESHLAKNKDQKLADDVWGLRAKVCVTDWNGDGWLDLLVGDSYLVKPELTEADRATERRLRTDLARAEKERLIALQKMKDVEKTAKSAKDRENKLRKANEDVAKFNRDIANVNREAAKLPKATNHGNIWLFQRKPPVSSTSSSQNKDKND